MLAPLQEKAYFCIGKYQTMKATLTILMTILLLSACNKAADNNKSFLLQGAWTLRHVEFPTGETLDYPTDNGETLCRIYEGDSTFYECQLTTTATGIIILPYSASNVTLINKGGGEWLYLERDNPRPLTIVNDSTVIIQRNGALYTWLKAADIYGEWGKEIRDIIVQDVKENGNAETRHFVLSTKERQQQSTIHWLAYAIGFILIIAVQYVITNQRSKRKLQLQLRQIQEEHTERALSVRQAMMAEEERFFVSDEYVALQRRVAEGQRLKEEEWTAVEQQLKRVYPGFTSQLRSLYPMSELEYQTCLLIKLRIAPKDIAAILARDTSTISTVRSRLYKKVFNRKGSTKDWDDFILSIGA